MSNNLSNSNTIMAGIKEVGHKVFGGYAELLRIPHTARYSIGSVIACMPFPMVGMTITISVQHYYGNYSLAGMLTAIQAIALAVATPLLGKLTDKFGQRQVSIPTILVWIVAAVALTTSITNRAPEWVLYCLTPFLAAIPPWGAMSRARWTKILKGDQERTNRALSLCGVLDECMWVIGNPLASTLAVISGLLAFSFTGMCVVVGALMFLTELTTEPPSQTQLARAEGISRKEYREREAARAEALKVETAAEETRRRLEREGVTDEATINAAIEQAVADARSGKKASIWGPGLIAVCVTWFGLGAFQSATGISIIAFATESNMKQCTGFVFQTFPNFIENIFPTQSFFQLHLFDISKSFVHTGFPFPQEFCCWMIFKIFCQFLTSSIQFCAFQFGTEFFSRFAQMSQFFVQMQNLLYGNACICEKIDHQHCTHAFPQHKRNLCHKIRHCRLNEPHDKYGQKPPLHRAFQADASFDIKLFLAIIPPRSVKQFFQQHRNGVFHHRCHQKTAAKQKQQIFLHW